MALSSVSGSQNGSRDACLAKDLGAVDLGLVRTLPFTKLLGKTAGQTLRF